MKQELKAIQRMDEVEVDEGKDDGDELDMDERVIVEQLRKENTQRRDKCRQFYRNIKEVYQSLMHS